MRRLSLRVVSLVLVSVLAALLGAGTVLAQEKPQEKVPDAATSLKIGTAPRLDSKGKPAKGQMLLTATLTTADGKGVNSRQVGFYQQVELLGSREMDLGKGTTDSSGTATLIYQPAEAGAQTIKVYFSGGSGLASAQASSTIQVTDAHSAFETEALLLSPVVQWMPVAVGVLVLVLWAILHGVFVVTVIGVRAAAVKAPEASLQPATAPATTARR